MGRADRSASASGLATSHARGGSPAGPALVGRAAELERIDALLAAPERLPAAILLHGDEGAGKTILWTEAVRRAGDAGYRVLESALSRSESTLAFAGLADLLGRHLDDVLPMLAAPQAVALEMALAISHADHGAPDERAVAFGFHAALAALASRGPIVVAVDDVQWLDPSSALMLSYAVRRLRREPVLLILARRDGEGTDRSAALTDGIAPILERIAVGPLPLGAIHRLIRLRFDASLTRPQLLRVFDASEGNPLHALELARAILSSEPRAPGAAATMVADRVRRVAERSRTALALGAISTERELEVLEQAYGARRLLADLQPAIDAELVSVDGGRLRFAHPLVAAAAEAAVAASVRRDLHRRLASAVSSPAGRALHLANAMSGPDAEVARTVEAAAREARARGARATSAQLWEAAARLTPDLEPRDAARRYLDAAEGWYEAGDLRLAETILQRLLDGLEGGDDHAEAAWRMGILRDEAGRWQEATALWRSALDEIHDPALAARVRCSLAVTAYYTESVQSAVTWASDAVREAERSSNRVILARSLAIHALTLAMSGIGGHEASLQRALDLGTEADGFLGDWSPSAVAAECARHAGDVAMAEERFEALLGRAMEAGDVNVEQWAAYGLASTVLLAGDLQRASELADVVLDLSDQTGQMTIPARCLRAHIDAYLGRSTSARALVTEAIADARAAGEASHLFSGYVVLAAIETCAGDMAAAARAYAESRRIAIPLGLAHAGALRACLNEAEVAAAAGELEQAKEALATFDARSRGTPPAWSPGILHRARGAVLAASGDLEAARSELERAAAETDAMPMDRGQTLLALGVACRRLRERGRARELLQNALDLFETVGTPPWTARARHELARIPGRRSGGTSGLTEGEGRIAELVAAGHSNREVAATLFLSVKTIEVTLTRVYQKLGLRSRAELVHRLAGRAKQ